MSAAREKPAGATAVRPFRVEIPQAEVGELRRRITAARWPEKETVDDEIQGSPLARLSGTRSLRAATVLRRSSCGVPDAALALDGRGAAYASVRRGDRVAQLGATRPRRAGRPCRPGELLDADVHQLAAPGAVRSRVVAGLPRRRTRRHRGPHAGVLLRARDRPHPAGDQGARDRLSGRGRQPLRRSGTRSTTTTGRRSTSSTRRASSATTTSAKEATTNPSESFSDCSACSANSFPSKDAASRRQRTGTTSGRPRHISATGAASASRQPTVPRSSPAPTSYQAAAGQPLGARRRLDDRERERRP